MGRDAAQTVLGLLKRVTREYVKVDRVGCPWRRRLADIVHGADTVDRDYTPQSPGLRAIAEGFHYLGVPDQERLFHGFAIYDALYAWCQHAL